MNHAITGLAADQGRSEPPCNPWKFWATTAWATAAFVVWIGAQLLAAVALSFWWELDVRQIPHHQLGFSLIVLASAPAFILVVVVAVRAAGASVGDYLALAPPRRRDLVLGLACVAVLLPLSDLATWLSGRDVVHPFMVENYIRAREAGGGALVALTLAFVVAAPAVEEMAFRGFVYRGWSQSRLGPVGAIALTAAVWAVIHVQYEFFFLLQIFVIGLLFGWLRWRSGSTLLTIVLHFLINVTALLQTAVVVAWRA
jgi:membrane protease YdiL (CAAX protease family)